MSCLVCDHANRFEIEQALLHLSETCTLEAISKLYEVPIEDLKQHAIFHNPMNVVDVEDPSISKMIKISEADIVSETIKEYSITLKNIGRRINNYACSDVADVKLEKILTKSVVDLYLGLGSEIRQSVKALAEINQILNGPKDDSTSGLEALALAINASRRTDD